MPAVNFNDPLVINDVIQKLGDSDFAVRQGAQELLGKIPLTQREALAKIAEKTTDEEIKARLIEHVGMMDERLATEFPLISLDVRSVPLTEVAQALGKATGTGLGTVAQFGNGWYTLKATDQPFWEVMRELAAQHPMWLAPPEGAALGEGSYAHIQVFRGFAFMTDDATLTPAAQVSMTLYVALDPRMAVLDLHPMRVDDARDDQGRLLHAETDPRAALARAALARRSTLQAAPHFQTRTVLFGVGAPAGKTITVKGTVNLLVQVSATAVEIANATQRINEAIAVGDSVVTVRELKHSAPGAGGKVAGLTLQIVPKGSAIAAPEVPGLEITANGISLGGGLSGGGGACTVVDFEGKAGGVFFGVPNGGDRTRIVVTDARGKTVANYMLPKGRPVTSVHIVKDDFQEPLTFTVTMPTRTREAVIPFEFKDLPIKK
jgi:hypothetical protein